ncbi:MAG: cyclic 2,3-diphosphoglycerate synthase [Methanosarcinales archaeon]
MNESNSLVKPQTNVIIMGAAGRDFHNFNVYFRKKEEFKVVAFTAAQIPFITDRVYPSELAGTFYPDGIPICSEVELMELIRKYRVGLVVFSYSDLPHEYVMHKASTVLAAGADFLLLGPDSTMLRSKVPVISVCAVRTGCGKSMITRYICKILNNKGIKPVVIRHPMAYGNLLKKIVMRFETNKDMDRYEITIEEREEFDPLLANGIIVYAGVDYEKILMEAEKEGEVIVWDGGNNDLPFIKSDLEIVVLDPLRLGNEMSYHPGEANFRRAHVLILNKINTAKAEDIDAIVRRSKNINPSATLIKTKSIITIDSEESIRGKKVLVIEDGPTLTHGGMTYGAATIAAEKYGVQDIIDPRPYAVGTIKKIFENYPKLGKLLPAVGYSAQQIKDLEETINKIPCDSVLSATPADLSKLLKINKPVIRVEYEIQETGHPNLEDIIDDFLGAIRNPQSAIPNRDT